MSDKVRFTASVDEFGRMLRNGDLDGEHVTLRYDSAFGGEQEATGTVEVHEQVLARDTAVIGNREIDAREVRSGETGRTLGEVVSVEVTVDKETAIETVTKHWNGHDVDDAGDEIYVQYWENDHTGETTLTRV